MSQSWQCRLFGPGLAPAGAPATLEIAGERIVVRCAAAAEGGAGVGGAAGGEVSVAAADVYLRRVGVDDRGLELAFTPPEAAAPGVPRDAARARGQTHACHVLDAAAAAALLAALPAGARLDRRAIDHYDQSKRTLRRAGLAALALVLLLPLLLLLWVLANLDGIASAVVARIPRSQETALAAQYREAFERDPTYRRDGVRHRVVADIGERLAATGTSYAYTFFVADDPAVNAFALPGGLVVVNDGLIDATARPEELAGVLAHELQHVELRHGLRALVKEAGLAAALALLTGDASGTLAGDLGRRLAGLQFSRDAEREADLTGLARLEDAGIDPSGMVEFFETLGNAGGGVPVAFLSTHPTSDVRAQHLREALAATSSSMGRELRFPYLETWPPPADAPAR